MKLLNENEIRDYIRTRSESSQRTIVISAYIKKETLDLLQGKNSDVTIVGRFRLDDFLQESSDLEVISLALDSGWEIRLNTEMHAKLYLFDNRDLVIGSANFTNSGLGLSCNSNRELAALLTNIDYEMAKKINYFKNDSIVINEEIYHEMLAVYNRRKLEYVKRVSYEQHDWPFEKRVNDLWVKDFPFREYGYHEKDDEYVKHDEDLFKYGLKNSKSYRWLKDQLLKEESRELYFGTVVKYLHDTLLDDPKVYRKSVKELIINLKSYIEHEESNIKTDKPNHSIRFFYKK